jgi:hypothetical protein
MNLGANAYTMEERTMVAIVRPSSDIREPSNGGRTAVHLQQAIARIVAVILMSGVIASVAEAAVIRGSATFEVAFFGDEDQGVFDPPLLGPGTFVVRSPPYNPDSDPPFEFDVLDFSFSFAGRSWDESDIAICECFFTADGEPLDIFFNFSDDGVSWTLAWNFEDGNFGFSFHDGNLDLSGSSENGQASSEFDSSFHVVPEPGSLGLLALGVVGAALLSRRRAAN